MKSDFLGGLAKATWPVVAIDSAWTIQEANPAAIEALGLNLTGGVTSASSIWPMDGEGPADFFTRWEGSVAAFMPLRLRGTGGGIRSYQAAVTVEQSEARKLFLVQLLPPTAGGTVEASIAHKQKLDCALQLARTVSLDFNNALTIILGHTSLMLTKMEPNNPWRKALMEVEKSAAKAAEIANDLGVFSRPEKEPKVQMSGNLNLLLQRNVESFKSVRPDKQINWVLQLERRLFSAKFDEAKLQQALVKVMENAIESLGQGGKIVLYTKNLELTEPTQDRNTQLAAGSYVCAEISDNGCGIEADVLPRIFEPFFTTKKETKHRGLGLAWVYGIVTNHGGGVAVSSQPGLGTSVRIYLPADKKYVRDHSHHTNDLSGTETILMVDDEDLLLTMGEAVLASYGYRVLTANSGQRALDILSAPDSGIDLMITDLVMPNMSGRELVEHVNRIAPHIRVLCSSGYVRPTTAERDDVTYLQKPFTSQELLLKVRQALAAPEPTHVD